MRTFLTFDVEVWCNGWSNLDAEFPHAFSRYVYGSSKAGSYALPKTLEILSRHRLKAVFFVEPLFAARFGLEHLRTIVSMIQAAGQEVQLHLHPEWTDEIKPAPLPGVVSKRQFLRFYSQQEQKDLIALGIRLLEEAGAPRPDAFRAGGFAANRDTYPALASNGLRFDSSIAATVAESVPDLVDELDVNSVREIDGVQVFPLSIFQDGFGRLRHAQVGACSTRELVHAMERASQIGWSDFVILSHNFELLKPGSTDPNWTVVQRFERLCGFLDRHRDEFPMSGFRAPLPRAAQKALPLPKVGRMPTMRRYAEQALQHLI